MEGINSKNLSGVFTALVTPFKDGEVDYLSLKKLLRWQLDGKVNGLVINGTTAESPTLSASEREKIFSFVKSEIAGQVPLVIGTGTNSTSDTVLATQRAHQMGADAALVVVPYYNKPPQRGLFQHFQSVASCSDLPVILYNVPARTITKLEIDTISELSQLQNVVGIKEASGDLSFGQQILQNAKPGFLLMSGDDGSFLGLIRVGGVGLISVASNLLPLEFSNWCQLARADDKHCENEFLRFTELNSYLYVEANPIPIKTALYLKGLIATPEMRLPLTPLSEQYVGEMKKKMQQAEIL